MATDNNISAALGITGTSGAASQSARKTNNQQIGQEEFLKLLVEQLKHQDPMEPMKNEDFAVNLAQFSSLEQLISINQKVSGDSSGGDFGSLASYLGHEVTFGTNEVELKDGQAGRARFKLDKDSTDVKLDLLDLTGRSAASFNLGALSAGKHVVDLSGIDEVANGQYTLKVTANDSLGGTSEPEVFAAGIVTGFVPGPDPLLVVGSKEVKTTDIKEVNLAG